MQQRLALGKSDDCAQDVLEDLKSALMPASALVPSDWAKPFRLHIDGSQLAVGATFTQTDCNGHDRAIVYTSKKLTAPEQNYTYKERENLSLISALRRFWC